MDYKAAVITVSDRCSAGERADKSGPAVAQMLEEAGFRVIYRGLVPDERHEISAEFIKCSYELGADLIISTGGTGFGKRDITPEATRDVISREIPAIPQAMLHYSLGITPRAMLTRGVAGMRGKSLILNLPGNETGARQNLSAVLGVLEHALQMISKDE
jgi:molybdopterin adenylyltransferase